MRIETLYHEHLLSIDAEKQAFNNLVNQIVEDAKKYGVAYDYPELITNNSYRLAIMTIVLEKFIGEDEEPICPECGEAPNDHDEQCSVLLEQKRDEAERRANEKKEDAYITKQQVY